MVQVYIVNETHLPLNISLKHLGPVHFENGVPPRTGVWAPKVGAVYFTIEARVGDAHSANRYTRMQVAVPIVLATVGSLALAAGAVYVAGGAGAAAVISGMTAKGMQALRTVARKRDAIAKIGNFVGISSTITTAKSVIESLLQSSVVSSAGWHMRQGRHFYIRGGPSAKLVDGTWVIDADDFTPFEVVADEYNAKNEDGKPNQVRVDAKAPARHARGGNTEGDGGESESLRDSEMAEEEEHTRETEREQERDHDHRERDSSSSGRHLTPPTTPVVENLRKKPSLWRSVSSFRSKKEQKRKDELDATADEKERKRHASAQR